MSAKSRGKAKASGKFSPNHASELASQPPSPFTKAPTNLDPFLGDLPKDHIYITHIDSTPRDFKKQIFIVPVLLNVGIILLLLWRSIVVIPFYTSMVLDRMGYQNYTTLTPANMSWGQIFYEVAKRAGSFAFDFGLYMFVLPWPQAFLMGSDFGTPVEWRWNVGFRDAEVVVRRSKRWDESLGDIVTDQTTPGSRQFGAIVRLAVSKQYMQGRTGYSMLNKEWDLDFLAIQDATRLVDAKTLSLDDFQTKVFLYSEKYGWLVYNTEEGGSAEAEEEAQRRKIIAFKDELTSLKKESLFFKWIELIQWESSQPGGFGPERQAKTIEKASAMFAAEGVDFEAFWKKVGGMDGLPGMEQFQ